MKKILTFAVAGCIMALTASLVSCNPDKTQCWKLIAVFDDKTQESYFWGSGVEADAQLEIYHRAGANTIRREQTFLSKENCH